MRKILLITSTLIFLSLSIAGANALTISIPDVTGNAGKTVTVPVNIEDASDVGSVELAIVYNSSLLSIKKVEKGSLLKGLISYNDTEEGIVAINLVDSNGINGDGEIIKVTFDVIGAENQNTTLLIQNARAYDVNTYTELPVETINGVLMISAGGAAGSGQTPGFEIVFFMIALLAITLITRKKK